VLAPARPIDFKTATFALSQQQQSQRESFTAKAGFESVGKSIEALRGNLSRLRDIVKSCVLETGASLLK